MLSIDSLFMYTTGKLGSMIADNYAVLPDIKKIYYVCNKTAILPHSEKVIKLYVDSVASLEKMITNIVIQSNIDIIIHSMAVSDYRVRTITSTSDIANLIVSQQEVLKNANARTAESIITGLFKNSKAVTDGNGKISSDVDNLLLLMERTPKVISLFQNISPQSILVGFKLLDSVPHEMLIDTAFRSLQTNKCGFVLANDLHDVDSDSHIGYLVDSNKNYKTFLKKREIADGIVAATLDKRRNS